MNANRILRGLLKIVAVCLSGLLIFIAIGLVSFWFMHRAPRQMRDAIHAGMLPSELMASGKGYSACRFSTAGPEARPASFSVWGTQPYSAEWVDETGRRHEDRWDTSEQFNEAIRQRVSQAGGQWKVSFFFAGVPKHYVVVTLGQDGAAKSVIDEMVD